MLCCILDFTEGLGWAWTGMFQPCNAPGLGCSSSGSDNPGMLLDLDAPVLGFSPQSGMQKQKLPRDRGKAEHEDALLLP